MIAAETQTRQARSLLFGFAWLRRNRVWECGSPRKQAHGDAGIVIFIIGCAIRKLSPIDIKKMIVKHLLNYLNILNHRYLQHAVEDLTMADFGFIYPNLCDPNQKDRTVARWAFARAPGRHETPARTGVTACGAVSGRFTIGNARRRRYIWDVSPEQSPTRRVCLICQFGNVYVGSRRRFIRRMLCGLNL